MDEALLNKLLEQYEQAENSLLAIMKRYALSGADLPSDEAWVTSKYQNIKSLKEQTIKVLQALKGLDEDAKQAVIEEYLRGARTHSESFIATNTDALSKYTADLLGQLQSSRYQILRSVDDSYRRIIGEASAQSVVGIDTRIIAARRALAKFAQQGITGFIDNRGRQWDIRSYTEMSTRTALNNAFREGRIAGVEDANLDLIIVSSVPNPSDICSPWERKVLSISGKGKYPSLAEAKAAGLFHPNCRHSFTVYTPGLTNVGRVSEIPDAEKGQDNYEAMQQQRYLERQERKWKRVLIVDPDSQRAKDKVADYRNRIKELTKEYDLVRKPNRESNTQAR